MQSHNAKFIAVAVINVSCIDYRTTTLHRIAGEWRNEISVVTTDQPM